MESSTREQVTDQHSSDLEREYSVLITWGDDPTFRVPCSVMASSMREAAQRRVDLLGDPIKYNCVAVVSSNTGYSAFDDTRIEVFEVREFLTPLQYERVIRDVLIPDGERGPLFPSTGAPERLYGPLILANIGRDHGDEGAPWIPTPEELDIPAPVNAVRKPQPKYGWWPSSSVATTPVARDELPQGYRDADVRPGDILYMKDGGKVLVLTPDHTSQYYSTSLYLQVLQQWASHAAGKQDWWSVDVMQAWVVKKS